MTNRSRTALSGLNLLYAGMALAAVAVFATGYLFLPHLYSAVLRWIGFHAQPIPFYDAEFIAQNNACWHKGFDVYFYSPCNVMLEGTEFSALTPYDYGPLLLRIPALPTGPFWMNVYGLAAALAFVAALTGLPHPRSSTDALIGALAVLSPPVFYAAERGNLDLVLFAGTMLVVVLMEKSFAYRIVGYAVCLLMGAAKIYPLVLLGLAARERLGRALAIVLAGVLGTAAYVWAYRVEFARMMINLSHPSIYNQDQWGRQPYDHNAFGAKLLGIGLADMARHGLGVSIDPRLIMAPFLIVAVSIAFLAARRPTMAALKLLPSREALCLTAGGLIFTFCFFFETSFGFKAIYVLLIVPSLLAAARLSNDRHMAAGWRAMVAAVLAVIWLPPFAHLIDHYFGWFDPEAGLLAASRVSLVFWLLGEALWWIVGTAILSVVIGFFLNSTAWEEITRYRFRDSRPRSSSEAWEGAGASGFHELNRLR